MHCQRKHSFDLLRMGRMPRNGYKNTNAWALCAHVISFDSEIIRIIHSTNFIQHGIFAGGNGL